MRGTGLFWTILSSILMMLNPNQKRCFPRPHGSRTNKHLCFLFFIFRRPQGPTTTANRDCLNNKNRTSYLYKETYVLQNSLRPIFIITRRPDHALECVLHHSDSTTHPLAARPTLPSELPKSITRNQNEQDRFPTFAGSVAGRSLLITRVLL